MGYQKKKISDSRILEHGNGYQLLLLEGATVSEIREQGREIVFTGKKESLLTIAKEEDFAEEKFLGHTVQKAFAEKNGSLKIEYTNGFAHKVPSDVYEPWELNSEGSFQVVSSAGGGIAIWL